MKSTHYNYDKDTIMTNNNMIACTMVLLVVIYHSLLIMSNCWYNNFIPEHTTAFEITPLYGIIVQFLNNIHVPILFIISGYTFSYKMMYTNTYNDVSIYIRKKIFRLAIPFLLISLLWIMPIYAELDPECLPDLIRCFPFNFCQLWYISILFIILITARLTWSLTKSNMATYIVANICCAFVIATIIQKATTSTILQATIYVHAGILIQKYNIIEKFTASNKILTSIAYAITLLDVTMLINKRISDPMFNVYLRPFYMLPIIIFLMMNKYLLLNTKLRNKSEHSKSYNILRTYQYRVYLLHEQLLVISAILTVNRIPIIFAVLISFISAILVSMFISKLLCQLYFGKILFGENTSGSMISINTITSKIFKI